ncbi:MAG: PIN domain nuclease [Desulfobacterales bacterium]|nr:PIN domain nuclease [Desulfobacterales bacterium]
MMIVDTSVWIEIFTDKTGSAVKAFKAFVGSEDYALTRFTQMELLQGAKNEKEWRLLSDYLSTQLYVETSAHTWEDAARIYYELRRKGRTVNSPIDCCIAQLAIENGAVLLHQDQDFEQIARIRPLAQEYFITRI